MKTLVAITRRKVRNFKTVYKVKTLEISKNFSNPYQSTLK